MGFSIHIHSDDSVTGYGSWVQFCLSSNAPRCDHLRRLRANPSKKLTVKQVRALADALPLGGNPAGVLVTSDKPLKDSKVIHKVLDNLFGPGIQLFYIGNRKRDGTDQAPTVLESGPVGKEDPNSESELRPD